MRLCEIGYGISVFLSFSFTARRTQTKYHCCHGIVAAVQLTYATQSTQILYFLTLRLLSQFNKAMDSVEGLLSVVRPTTTARKSCPGFPTQPMFAQTCFKNPANSLEYEFVAPKPTCRSSCQGEPQQHRVDVHAFKANVINQ